MNELVKGEVDEIRTENEFDVEVGALLAGKHQILAISKDLHGAHCGRGRGSSSTGGG